MHWLLVFLLLFALVVIMAILITFYVVDSGGRQLKAASESFKNCESGDFASEEVFLFLRILQYQIAISFKGEIEVGVLLSCM